MTRTVAISVALTVAVVALTVAWTAVASESRVSIGDVLTGHDLGVRVLDIRDDRVIGEFVVRIEGEWLDVKEPAPPPVLPARP